MALSESTRAGQMTRDQKVLKKMQLSNVLLNPIRGGVELKFEEQKLCLPT
jgi:hypothetical protein